jgi:hypothetical protein
MSVVGYESSKLQQIKIKSLQAQYEFLNLLRLRHVQWANSTDDPQIKGGHLAIVKQLERTAEQCSCLLDSLSLPGRRDGR